MVFSKNMNHHYESFIMWDYHGLSVLGRGVYALMIPANGKSPSSKWISENRWERPSRVWSTKINKGYPWVLSIDWTWLGWLISMWLSLVKPFVWQSKPQSCRLTRVDSFPILAAFRFHNAAWATRSAECHLAQTYTRTQLLHNRSTDFTVAPKVCLQT